MLAFEVGHGGLTPEVWVRLSCFSSAGMGFVVATLGLQRGAECVSRVLSSKRDACQELCLLERACD